MVTLESVLPEIALLDLIITCGLYERFIVTPPSTGTVSVTFTEAPYKHFWRYSNFKCPVSLRRIEGIQTHMPSNICNADVVTFYHSSHGLETWEFKLSNRRVIPMISVDTMTRNLSSFSDISFLPQIR